MPTASVRPEPSPEAAPASPVVPVPHDRGELVRHVRSLGVEAPPESETFGAVMLLIAAQRCGPNIDRLAGFTGLKREFVAHCVRRLVDNGIWRGGRESPTHYADAAEALRHAAVARGQLCRYQDETGERWLAPDAWKEPLRAAAEREPTVDTGETGADGGVLGWGSDSGSAVPTGGFQAEEARSAREARGFEFNGEDRERESYGSRRWTSTLRMNAIGLADVPQVVWLS